MTTGTRWMIAEILIMKYHTWKVHLVKDSSASLEVICLLVGSCGPLIVPAEEHLSGGDIDFLEQTSALIPVKMEKNLPKYWLMM